MTSWSSRRKLIYGSITLIVLILIIGIPAFLILYKAPTCFDKIMNSDEVNVDCGGSCVLLCQSSFISPQIAWGGAKFEKVANGLYNAAAYVINQNLNGGATNVPYKISLFDEKGILIIERSGSMNLYAHRNSLAFEPALDVGKRIPVKATFEFLQAPNWFKSNDNLGGLSIIDKKYIEDKSGSSLEVTLENKTLFPYKNIDVSVILLDSNDNAIGFSRTTIDSIESKNGREIAPFTWPISRKGSVTSIEVLPLITPQLVR